MLKNGEKCANKKKDNSLNQTLLLGVALNYLPLLRHKINYSLQIFSVGEKHYIGKTIALPTSLAELELLETHVQSILTKLNLPLKPLELLLISHDAE